MTSLYSPERDTTAIQRGAGPGVITGWHCPKCDTRQHSQLGRGKRYYGGAQQWVCKGCKAEIDARRAKA